MTLKIK